MTRARTKKPPPPRPRLRDRSTGDLLVLMVAGTVCFSVLASGFTVAIVSLVNPEVDTATWIARITGIMNTMIGLLAGFLAGRSDTALTVQKTEQRVREEVKGEPDQ